MSESNEEKRARQASETAGFVEREIYTFSPEQMQTGKVGLLLPNTNDFKTWAHGS